MRAAMTKRARTVGALVAFTLPLACAVAAAAPQASPGPIWPQTWIRVDAHRAHDSLERSRLLGRDVIVVRLPERGIDRDRRLDGWRDFLLNGSARDVALLEFIDIIAVPEAALPPWLAVADTGSAEGPGAWLVHSDARSLSRVGASALIEDPLGEAWLEDCLARASVDRAHLRRARRGRALRAALGSGELAVRHDWLVEWTASRVRARVLVVARCGLESMAQRSRCESAR